MRWLRKCASICVRWASSLPPLVFIFRANALIKRTCSTSSIMMAHGPFECVGLTQKCVKRACEVDWTWHLVCFKTVQSLFLLTLPMLMRLWCGCSFDDWHCIRIIIASLLTTSFFLIILCSNFSNNLRWILNVQLNFLAAKPQHSKICFLLK